ncbi:Phosphotransferase related to Ser/Thr protein kinase [Sterolibacterium denitrificans]|uniref:Phosphotransferase related to Ser/Thr protein kinase n=1 Tax=Sterolibacterium denitrificans TaxID=157592 RepID=A0A7Z7HNT2_9PROT|nr:phosphotransferase [Sterolibacterium denitrificans]SMB21078.1 Phosphotransferase related to Ser/Thr protein kinase [Sterolibacterium denitrificans]
MERQRQIIDWLQQLQPGRDFSLAPASADASFRRYFRVRYGDGRTLIVMDAPPGREDCRPWLHVQQLFAATGAHVPEVLAQDAERGFLLLSDLGGTTYLAVLQADPGRARTLYEDAATALIRIQAASRPGVLPEYDRALLLRELMLFPDWYVAKHLGIDMNAAQRNVMERAFERILAVNLDEPRVFVHRDYHSRNLMLLDGEDGNNPGIIDFQDAVYGPLSYDLVSLFKDAYIEWDEEQTLDWLVRYWEKARKTGLPVRADFGEFHRDYEWMGVQRHIKVLGIFARLCHRDGKEAYLKDMPLVMKYLRHAADRYRELGPFLKLLDELEGRQEEVGYTF